MKEVPAEGTDLKRLHVVVDAELAQVEASKDPEGFVEPEVVEYETRLRSLHDAVAAMEAYEDGLDQA